MQRVSTECLPPGLPFESGASSTVSRLNSYRAAARRLPGVGNLVSVPLCDPVVIRVFIHSFTPSFTKQRLAFCVHGNGTAPSADPSIMPGAWGSSRHAAPPSSLPPRAQQLFRLPPGCVPGPVSLPASNHPSSLPGLPASGISHHHLPILNLHSETNAIFQEGKYNSQEAMNEKKNSV